MKQIWDIKLFELKCGIYCIKISCNGEKEIKGMGTTPQRAYSDTIAKMTIRPWLVNGDNNA